MSQQESSSGPAGPEADRRGFLAKASTVAMTGGIVAGYGGLAAVGARYLFPAEERKKAWIYVADVAAIPEGGSLRFRAPTGERIAVARQGSGDRAEDFIALSSTCPHLGCQVHWEPHNTRFFCPCHNGVFTPEGKAIAGPPAEAGQSLGRYPLQVENGLLYIEVPLESVSSAATAQLERLDDDGARHGPGHDPCLDAYARTDRRA
jgi:Rieske Fe-S protein